MMAFIDQDGLTTSACPTTSTRLAVELGFERAVCADRSLSLFRRNAATWELLLLLAASDRHERLGVYEAVANIQSTALGHSALLKFIRDRRDDGLLITLPQAGRRNKLEIGLEPDMLERLCALLCARNRDGAYGAGALSPDGGLRVTDTR